MSGTYCAMCGAPLENRLTDVTHPIYGHGFSTVRRCPNADRHGWHIETETER